MTSKNGFATHEKFSRIAVDAGLEIAMMIDAQNKGLFQSSWPTQKIREFIEIVGADLAERIAGDDFDVADSVTFARAYWALRGHGNPRMREDLAVLVADFIESLAKLVRAESLETAKLEELKTILIYLADVSRDERYEETFRHLQPKRLAA